MSLRGIVPKTNIDGFYTEIIKHFEPILAVTESGAKVIDYCYEIGVTCIGTNPHYSTQGRAVVVVSQFVGNGIDGVVIEDDRLPVVILGHTEELGSIQLVEAKRLGQQQAMLIVTIVDQAHDTRRTLAWSVKKSEMTTVH